MKQHIHVLSIWPWHFAQRGFGSMCNAWSTSEKVVEILEMSAVAILTVGLHVCLQWQF
jgi:hypothetical protein